MSADENLHDDYKLPGDIKDFSDWARDDILFLTERGLTEPGNFPLFASFLSIFKTTAKNYI